MSGIRCRMITLAALLTIILSTCAHAQVSDANRKLVTEIAEKIFPLVKQPPKGYAWPPKLDIDPSDEINAYATLGPHMITDTSFQPQVVVLNGLLTTVTKGNPDYLAFIIGHETAHLALGHCKYDPELEGTGFLRATFTREQEIEADIMGMELAVKAGYSFRRALDGIKKMSDEGLPYSSFEGLGVDHPSWNDRLSYIDKDQAKFWRAMSAFDNGNVFLMIEQYFPAEHCFKAVTKEFPRCHEAWANLGYAQLMNYCDALGTSDLKKFAIGHLVTGGFYRRPASMVVRLEEGINESLWWDAVGALRQSLQIKPDQPLVKANLGIAYLVHPRGSSDVGAAARFFQEAVDEISKDKSIGPLEKAAVLMNAGVGDLIGGNVELCLNRLQKAAEASEQEIEIRGEIVMFAGEERMIRPTDPVMSALFYNAALVCSRSSSPEVKKQGIEYLEEYLTTTNPASAWWPIAHEQYEKLCRDHKVTPKSASVLKDQEAVYRHLTSVTVGNGKLVTVSSSITDVIAELGAGQESTIVPNTSLKRIKYPAYGIDILATREVLAIVLNAQNSPAIQLKGMGLGSAGKTLKVGMSEEAIIEILGDLDCDVRPMLDPDVNYYFFPDLGLAVNLRGGKVSELLVVQIPLDY